MSADDRIPVGRVVSAAGFVTSLGGGSLSPGVVAAITEVAGGNWPPDALQAWAGTVISDVTGAEDGWITAGAAAGMTLAAAACIAGTSPAALDRLPESGPERPEIVVQRGHRNAYDRALRATGARLVEIGYPGREGVGCTYGWQLEEALNARTAAVSHLALADGDGLSLATVCEVAHRRSVPVIVDASAELPPSANLRRFLEQGADIVIFSGGKAIRGPQASGVLAGRRDLVAAVRLMTIDMDVDPVAWARQEGGEPPHHGIGRAFKVGKEEIVGAATALREFVARDHDAERAELRGWLETLQAAVSVDVRLDDDGHFYPRLVLAVGDARGAAERLAAEPLPVIVPHAPLARSEIVVCPEAIDESDRPHVAAALGRALG